MGENACCWPRKMGFKFEIWPRCAFPRRSTPPTRSRSCVCPAAGRATFQVHCSADKMAPCCRRSAP
jgi:hypothetical protein